MATEYAHTHFEISAEPQSWGADATAAQGAYLAEAMAEALRQHCPDVPADIVVVDGGPQHQGPSSTIDWLQTMVERLMNQPSWPWAPDLPEENQ